MKYLNGMLAAAFVSVNVGAPMAIATPRATDIYSAVPVFTQVASKAQVKDKAKARELQSKIDAGIKSLEGNKELLNAAVKKDTKTIEAMLRQSSGIEDVPMTITYVGEGVNDPKSIKIWCKLTTPPFGFACRWSYE